MDVDEKEEKAPEAPKPEPPKRLSPLERLNLKKKSMIPQPESNDTAT